MTFSFPYFTPTANGKFSLDKVFLPLIPHPTTSSLSLSPSLPPPLTHSLSHSLPPSLPHSLTPSLPPSLTHSLSHFLPPSLPHSLTLSLTPSLPHSLSPSLPPSLPRSFLPSLPHSLHPGLPDENGRLEIFNIHTSAMRRFGKLAADVQLDYLASKTRNFSGAEIEGLVRSAQATAMNRMIKVWISLNHQCWWCQFDCYYDQ